MGEQKEQEKTESVKIREFLDLAIKRLKKCVDSDEHNRIAALEDLRFLNGEQWDEKEKKKRKSRGRPVLQINLLPKFVDQVVGDERHNRPKVKIRPVDSKADVHIAKIREGIICNVEYISNAPAIYDEAFESTVSCGYGAWRILTRYTEENPFLQEIYKEAIENPFLVFMDPDSKDAVFADAKYGFILRRIPVEDFKDDYPGKEVPGEALKTSIGIGHEQWFVDDTVTVAEYFVRETYKNAMCLMSDGQVLTKQEAEDLIQEWEDSEKLRLNAPIPQATDIAPTAPQSPPPGLAPPGLVPPGAPPANPMVTPGAPPTPSVTPLDIAEVPNQEHSEEQPRIIKERDADVFRIKHYIITASEIIDGGLEGKLFPGKYIPIVLVRGKKRNIEGKRYIRGLIRDAKDPQRMVNYWNTAAAETVALAPKAPWVGTAKMFEGYENDYATANTDNFPFLKFNIDPASPTLMPQRTHTGDPPMAIFAQIARGEENIKSVIGMFDADVGADSAGMTGNAYVQRQKPGDIGTFAFLDNLSRSVMHSAKIVNEMIPEVYDTERDVRVRHLDDTETQVPVNTTVDNAIKMVSANKNRFRGMDVTRLKKMAKEHGRGTKFNDLTVGKYDVMVTTGPSYATARAESVDTLTKLLQTNPPMAQIAMDLVVENMDFKDADKLAARLRKMLPPGLVPPKDDEEPPLPKPPSPQQVVAEGKLKVEQMKLEVQKERLQVEKIKALKEAADAKGEVKKMIFDILKEVHSSDHIADQVGRPSPGNGPETPPPQGGM